MQKCDILDIDHGTKSRRQRYKSLCGCNLGLDDLDDGGLGEGGEITELVAFACDDLSHDTTHDLLN